MSRSRRVLAVIVAFSILAVPAAAVGAEPPQPGDPNQQLVTRNPQALSYEQGPEVLAESSGPAARALGTFWTRSDNPHISYTSGFKEVSVHGWWTKETTKATKAKVTVTLQALTKNGWRTVATGSKVVAPGTYNRGNARVRCVNDDLYTYRSIVDVDLVGHLDDNATAGRITPKPLQCGFAW